MAKIIITDIPGYDGTHELNVREQPFSTVEWEIIVKHTGYLPGTIEEGFTNSDPRLVCACAVIALVRSSTVTIRESANVYARLAGVPFDGSRIMLDLGDDEEAVAAELEAEAKEHPTKGPLTDSGDTNETPDETPHDGQTSNESSAVLELRREASGVPNSAMPELASETSAS